MKQYGAEFFGTFWLVLGGCGSAVSLPAYRNWESATSAWPWRSASAC